MKVIRLSALPNGRLYPQEISLAFISVKGLSRLQMAGMIQAMENALTP
jgi:hypothetical protein